MTVFEFYMADRLGRFHDTLIRWCDSQWQWLQWESGRMSDAAQTGRMASEGCPNSGDQS